MNGPFLHQKSARIHERKIPDILDNSLKSQLVTFDLVLNKLDCHHDFHKIYVKLLINLNKITESTVDPNEFIRWTYAKALSHRQPRYEKMSNWGITVKAEDIEKVKNSNQFNLLIESTLANK